MNREEIQARVNNIEWFHTYEIVPGIVTPGPGQPEQERLVYFQIPEDLQGKRVLDIGCADGYYTFLAESRGASVVAIDSWPHQGFFLAHQLRGSKAEFHQFDLYDLQPDTFGSFDVVFFMGVYYHLKNPILALERIAAVTRELVIIESAIMDLPGYETEGVSRFYEHDELAPGDPTNWWVPNPPCLLQTVRAAGFPRAEFICRYGNGTRGVVHAHKGPRTAEKMVTEDFVCALHRPPANQAVQGTVTVSGVAFSKLNPADGIERVTLSLDRLDDPASELGQATLGSPRPALAARVGEPYGASGFEFTWDTTGVPPGPHTLYMLAEGPRGWHYARRSIIIGPHSAAAVPPPETEHLPVDLHGKLSQAETLAPDIGVSLAAQPGWPLAGKVRRMLHRLAIYYVNRLAKKQIPFNQLIVAALHQLATAQDKNTLEVSLLQQEVKELRRQLNALKGPGE